MPPNNTIENSPQLPRPMEERVKRTMNSGLQHNGISGLQHNGITSLQHNGLSGVQHNGISGLQHNGISGLQHNGISRAFNPTDLPETSSSSLQSNGLSGLIDTAQFNREVERLKTFETWPVSFLSPSTMAAAGFYYLNRDDLVKCAFCGVEVGCWVEGDNPKEDHQRWSPSCSFVRNLPTGNVPAESNSSSSSQDVGVDTCGRYGIEFRDPVAESNVNIKDRSASLEKLGIHKNRAPSFPNFSSYEARLRSYEMWPIALKLKPNTLSEAGFFYTGKGDQTICFHCGGGLKDWEESDEPWVEHARWFSRCNFVIMIKGKEFVDSVCGKKITEEFTDKEGDSSSEGNVTVERNRTSSTVTSIVSESKSEKNIPESNATATSTSSSASSNTSDRNICKICYTEEMGVLFLPCGHLVACVKCALSLPTCAVCRQEVTATVRAFLS